MYHKEGRTFHFNHRAGFLVETTERVYVQGTLGYCPEWGGQEGSGPLNQYLLFTNVAQFS